MASYRVGTDSTGQRVWWDWQGAGFERHHTDIRDATEAEALLMEKVVWDRATDDECRQLREIIKQDKVK